MLEEWWFSVCSQRERDNQGIQKKISSKIVHFNAIKAFSTDHRGTPQNPGVVANLERGNDSDETVGVAFLIPKDKAEETIATLDFRERGGYTKELVQLSFFDNPQKIIQGFVYTGQADNPNYISGELRDNVNGIAKIISRAEGPSGKNVEYLFNLADFVRSVGVDDPHVFAIERAARKELKLGN